MLNKKKELKCPEYEEEPKRKFNMNVFLSWLEEVGKIVAPMSMATQEFANHIIKLIKKGQFNVK